MKDNLLILETNTVFIIWCLLGLMQRVAACNQRRASSVSRKPSLQLLDTPDGLRDLGTLELMGRELNLSGGTLNRTASSESLCSISSIAQTFGHDFTVGQLEVTLEQDTRASLLLVSLHQGKDLLEKEEENFLGCYITVTLVPQQISLGATRVLHHKTSALSWTIWISPASLILNFKRWIYKRNCHILMSKPSTH